MRSERVNLKSESVDLRRERADFSTARSDIYLSRANLKSTRRLRLSKWAHQGVLSLHIYFHFALLHLRMVGEWIIRHLIRKGDQKV